MMKITRNAVFVFIFLILFFPAFSDNGEDSDELLSLAEERRQTLKYGIDSEIISLLGKITDEKDSSFTEDVDEIFSETNNSEIMDAAVTYFIAVDHDKAVDTAAERIKNWEDEPYNVLAPSLRYLSAFPDSESEDLIIPIIEHENKLLSSAALAALGKCGTEKSVDILLDLLDDDFDDELKPSILKTLGDIGSVESIDTLIDILEDVDEEKSWRWNACEALGKIGDPQALPAIEFALQDSDTYLRAKAVKALATFDADDIEETLIQALKDSFWRVRVSAAEALGERQSRDAVDILMYKAEKDPEKNVKLAAVEALGMISGNKSLEFLRKLYSKNNTTPSIRAKTAEIIIEKDLDNSLEDVFKVMDSEWEKDNSQILNYTCQFLSKAENTKLEPLFERMLGHNNVAIKIYGIRGIQLNHFSGLKERLESLTEEGVNNSVRKAALSAVKEL